LIDVHRYQLPTSVLTVIQPVPNRDPRMSGVEWYGYEEVGPTPIVRNEPASSRIVVILETDEPIGVGRGKRAHRYTGGFVAGLVDSPTETRHEGRQSGIQLNLSPWLAHVLLRMPPAEVARHVVAARDVIPGAWLRLVQDAELDWSVKMDQTGRLLSELMASQFDRQSRQWQVLRWVLDAIHLSRGNIRIEHLVSETGWSIRRLQRTFAAEIGMSPKRYARLIRFDALCSALRQQPRLPLADAAEALGYFDQPHLTRDVAAFAGVSPAVLAKQLQLIV
jgi:AraC-like DNA-binding protein